MSNLYQLFDRTFEIVAEFPDTEEGADKANEYMTDNDGACVLAVENGRIILADRGDKGTPVK